MNTRYLKIQTLTPLHIGTGRLLQGNTEYLYFDEERTVAIIDERKVLSIVGEENLPQWLDIISEAGNLLYYLRSRQSTLQPSHVAKRQLQIAPGSETPQLWQQRGNSRLPTLREQLFSGNGQPILPGSSLKGAIRTAVFNELVNTNPLPARNLNNFKQIDDRIDYRSQQVKRTVRYSGQKLESGYFSNVTDIREAPNHDLFRLLRIGDAHFDGTVCLLTETLNEKGDGSHEMKESVRQFAECIPAGAETICRVQIPTELMNRLNEARFRATAAKIPYRDRMGWPWIWANIRANTQRLIEHEIQRYTSQDLPNGARLYVEELIKLLSGLADNECIIRVGFGTGYLSMTGGWPLTQWRTLPDYEAEMNDLGEAVRHTDKYKDKPLPKSRKMVLGGLPLGFLKLTLLTEE